MGGLFYQRLDTVGDGSGSSNMAVDGSSTPVIFKIKPIPGGSVNIARIIMYIEDSGSFDSGKWGNGITITNGIEFKQKENGATTDLLGFPIKTSGDMASLCHDLSHHKFGSGNEFITYRWTFSKAGGSIELHAGYSDELQIIINDDLTDLVLMNVIAQGVYL